MELIGVCIKDTAVQAFNRPFFVRGVPEALRLFVDEVNRSASDNPMFNHSEDFELYRVCSFDDQSGAMVPFFELIVRAKDVRRSDV